MELESKDLRLNLYKGIDFGASTSGLMARPENL